MKPIQNNFNTNMSQNNKSNSGNYNMGMMKGNINNNPNMIIEEKNHKNNNDASNFLLDQLDIGGNAQIPKPNNHNLLNMNHNMINSNINDPLSLNIDKGMNLGFHTNNRMFDLINSNNNNLKKPGGIIDTKPVLNGRDKFAKSMLAGMKKKKLTQEEKKLKREHIESKLERLKKMLPNGTYDENSNTNGRKGMSSK